AGEGNEGRRGLQRTNRTLRKPGAGRRDRSDQGGPFCAAKRGLDCLAAADDGSRHLTDSGKASAGRAVRRWHGRHVLKSPPGNHTPLADAEKTVAAEVV